MSCAEDSGERARARVAWPDLFNSRESEKEVSPPDLLSRWVLTP